MAKDKGNAISDKYPSKDSRALIHTGPKEFIVKRNGTKRDENGLLPTDNRALILRNSKYGSVGLGGMTLSSRPSGREKLDLLAEELIIQSKSALAPLFRLEQAYNIADAQFNYYIDDIANLKDPNLFYEKILLEVKARAVPGASINKDASFISDIIQTRIHNSHMLAGGWKLVLEILGDLKRQGLSEQSPYRQLQLDEKLRLRFLDLYDMLNRLADLAQRKFSVLATTTAHLLKFFKKSDETVSGDSEWIFDWTSLGDAGKSFLDSIIIELVFPEGQYPREILYRILHDALDEVPKEAKRFPQVIWDAVGDLSAILDLQHLLEKPLQGPDGETWKTQVRDPQDDYLAWEDAQIYSTNILETLNLMKEYFNPLDKMTKGAAVSKLWSKINLRSEELCGDSFLELWGLGEAEDRVPHWNAIKRLEPVLEGSDSDDIGANKRKGRAAASRMKLAIDDDRGLYSDDSMPGLQSASDSMDELYSDSRSDDSDESIEYDSEDGHLMTQLLRAAMDEALEMPEFFDPKQQLPLDEDRKGNPFLKLLGSLRGRMFKPDAKLKTTSQEKPHRSLDPANKRNKTGTPSQTATCTFGDPEDPPPLHSYVPPKKPISPKIKTTLTTTPHASAKVTIEDVVDEGEIPAVAAVKKKKKKKKPKKKQSAEVESISIFEDAKAAPITPIPSFLSPESPPKPKSTQPLRSTNPSASALSLPIFDQPEVAQSARSYLKEKDSESVKEKVKTRPKEAAKKKIFATISSMFGKSKDIDVEPKDAKQSYFSKLSKRSASYMHQLLNTSDNITQGKGSLKWDHFVKLMKEMGFYHEPGTAGSSVRFDPPDKQNRSIIFHKPHPDSTIPPIMLREFGKRLTRYYGWTEADLRKADRL